MKRNRPCRSGSSEWPEVMVMRETQAVRGIISVAGDLRILLAEDDTVSRKLITRVLEKLGHRVVAVGDGAAAVSAIESQSFDLVFMDIRMPEMDGLEAARKIRQRERATGGHIPIVAVTAHVLSGYRELCLEAGMDDYLTKPLGEGDIAGASARHIAPRPNATACSEAGVVDLTQLLATVDGDRELVKELAGDFIEEYHSLLQNLHRAIEENDGETLARQAHTLKGAASHFRAVEAQSSAAQLEQIGSHCRLDEAPRVLATLEEAMRRVLDSFSEPGWEQRI